MDKVWKIPADGPQTLLECFQLGLKLTGPNGTICGTPSTDGKYQLKTYGDMEADSMLIGSALDYYGLIGARGRSFSGSPGPLSRPLFHGGISTYEIFRYDCNLFDKSI